MSNCFTLLTYIKQFEEKQPKKYAIGMLPNKKGRALASKAFGGPIVQNPSTLESNWEHQIPIKCRG